MKPGLSIVVLVTFFMLGCKHSNPFVLNKRDKQGKQHGYWKVYHTSDDSKLYYKGRFKHGAPKGRFIYYYPEGQIQETEVCRKDGIIQTTFYHRNGKPDLVGEAMFFKQKDSVFYHWQGQWQKYDSSGKHLEERTYIRGKLIWVRPIKDSL